MVKAFTLIEILITLALMSFFAVILFPFTIGTIRNGNLSSESANLASAIFKIQQDAFSSENDKAYGIRLNNTNYSILAGSDTSNLVVTETITFPGNISISNLNLGNASNEILFAKNNLKPNTTGNITLSNGDESYTVSINNEGLVEFQKN